MYHLIILDFRFNAGTAAMKYSFSRFFNFFLLHKFDPTGLAGHLEKTQHG